MGYKRGPLLDLRRGLGRERPVEDDEMSVKIMWCNYLPDSSGRASRGKA